MTVLDAVEFLGSVPPIRQNSKPCAMSASTTFISASRRRRCPAARPSASSSQRNSRGARPVALLHPRRTDHRCTSTTIKRLLGVLGRLADAGNTIVVIEHNLDVIKTADY